MTSRPLGLRLLALLGLLALGALLGWIGQRLTGTDWPYLAVPVMLALGWLKLADPTRCEAQLGAPANTEAKTWDPRR